MKILLDENLPHKLVAALRAEGHQTDSVHTLRMQGLDNGRLYKFAYEAYDLCFTRDTGFIHNVRQRSTTPRCKFLRVTIPQKAQNEFVSDFVAAFRKTDWAQLNHGDDWPLNQGG